MFIDGGTRRTTPKAAELSDENDLEKICSVLHEYIEALTQARNAGNFSSGGQIVVAITSIGTVTISKEDFSQICLTRTKNPKRTNQQANSTIKRRTI